MHYEIDDEVVWTDEERQCSAFASLCAPAICELAGTPEPFETMNDIESAIEHPAAALPGAVDPLDGTKAFVHPITTSLISAPP